MSGAVTFVYIASIHMVMKGQTPAGFTVLHDAVEGASLDIVRALLAYPTFECGTASGHTPLHLAARNGHMDLVRGLLYINYHVVMKGRWAMGDLELIKLTIGKRMCRRTSACLEKHLR